MKITAFCLCWLLILTAPGVMAQQSTAPDMTAQQSTTPNQSPIVPNQSWDPLRQLLAGDKLQVERKASKKKISGEFVGVSDTELVIERKGKNESLSRDEVKNVWRFVPPSPRDESPAAVLVIAPIIGIPLVLAAGKDRRKLVYSAP